MAGLVKVEARSSVVQRPLHAGEITGSNPVRIAIHLPQGVFGSQYKEQLREVPMDTLVLNAAYIPFLKTYRNFQ